MPVLAKLRPTPLLLRLPGILRLLVPAKRPPRHDLGEVPEHLRRDLGLPPVADRRETGPPLHRGQLL